MKVGLVGNPNVGKSTIFNALTGMHQHTGNWPGKTVVKASGYKKYQGVTYLIEDLPGTYSLMAHSKEEEVTRDFIYSMDYDALIIVCDAVCLERNLNLVLQILEINNKVVIYLNLFDKTKKKKIKIDINKLYNILKVPIVFTSARDGQGINQVMENLKEITNKKSSYLKLNYPKSLANEINHLSAFIENDINEDPVLLNLLGEKEITFKKYEKLYQNEKFLKQFKTSQNNLKKQGIKKDDIETLITETIVNRASTIANQVVTFTKKDYQKKERLIDKIVTHKFFSIPIMLLLLLLVFWLTITGANYPSQILYDLFFSIEDSLANFLSFIHIPDSINNMLVYGVYRVLAWVISVMLPPMLIFFPLFTLLEDLGYLPRIAFCLDKTFKKCASCGKQALTMAMGFGCNAVGVTGCRIIDSPRERLMAILTNVFVPCNGRFPLLITMITLFLIADGNSLVKSFVLTLFILIGIAMTFIITKILSKTFLKGVPSSFTLELPSYRKPQIIKVIIRSILDRGIFVLKRAIVASIPAGVIIWLMANINIQNNSILQICTDALDPFASLIGMDGVILMAFILALPANEIVIPIIIMGYLSLGYLTDMNDLTALKDLFVQNGWTVLTAVCVMLFSLMHWPCLTTILTIKKETGSLKWTMLSVLIPTIVGFTICFLVTLIYNLLF